MTRIVVIGGGAIGLSVAYHLARRGGAQVTLLERNQLTSGTTWHAAGIVGPLRATPNMTRLASYALELFPRLEQETGLSTGYRRTGGYWLARDPARLDELHRIADLGRVLGLCPQMVAPGAVDVPQLDLSAHVGALHVPEDGSVNPVDLCMAYAKAARQGGVTIRENTAVARLVTRGTRVTGVALHDGTNLPADQVVLCTGAWTRALTDSVGVTLPLQAVEHMYVVTEPIAGLPTPFPVLRDLDSGIYIKGDAGRLVIGGFEPDAKCWDPTGPEGDRPFLELAEDWDQFAPFMTAALTLCPTLAQVGIQRFMNGPESFTADTRPLIGPAPELDGLYVAAGMNSVGVMSSAGIGQALADWIVDGHPPQDMWEVDIARADPRSGTADHMQTRMREAVADLFALHWPFKQPQAGRNLRRSVLHDRWAAQGAVFGVTAGWERGLWYARTDAERALPYATGPQPWHPLAAREAAVMAQGCALLDLTPFTRLDLSGPSVVETLNTLTTAQIDVPIGRAVYTQMLNARGGIELDVTVLRLGPDHVRLTSGAATRWRDLAWLRRALPATITVTDLTDTACVLGVMGAGSSALIAGLCPDWTPPAFAHATQVPLTDAPCLITRLSYVGEHGYEITVPNAAAETLFDHLIRAGARPMGHYALDGCRVEKGFRHWGHDIGPGLTPLEAGLGFTIDWTKPFQGKAALEQHRLAGLTRRLVLLRVTGDALMLHDEPIFEEDRHVGLTTSGALGPRTGLTLAFGLIAVAPDETPEQTCARAFEVQVAGVRYPARALREAPFDPRGTRMRT